MQNGAIVENGTYKELMNAGNSQNNNNNKKIYTNKTVQKRKILRRKMKMN